MATPYVDYLKKVEQTKKEDLVLLIQKNFNQYEQKYTDISKYCNGFGYVNSSCFYNCENACPSTMSNVLLSFASCKTENCDNICSENTMACITQKNNCVINQNNCLAEKIFKQEPCPNDSSGNFGNFEECLDNCKTKCNDNCKSKFEVCSNVGASCQTCSTNLDPTANFPGVCEILLKNYCTDEFTKCQNICNNNSNCIISNKEKCLYSPQSLLNCTITNTDDENKKNCVESSGFTCKYGSSQQAGYADCLEDPQSLQNKFSASDIFKGVVDGPDYQKCPNPYLPNPQGSCYSVNSPYTLCGDSCPEVSKCPSASNCPDCPCTTLPLNLASSSSTSSNSSGSGSGSGSTSNSGSTPSQITDYQMVGGECQEYKYNDDPLTFYCRQDWWNEPALQAKEPLANSYICPKEKEIPVGQAIDDTGIWAQKLINYNINFIRTTDQLINSLKVIDTLNKSDNYCKCGSTCDDAGTETVCNAPCIPKLLILINPDGTENKICTCVSQGCTGNPCQRMLNLLKGKGKTAPCPKDKIIYGPIQFYTQIKKLFDTIDDFSLKSRTDIVKKLIYSRKTMNSCSSESKANTVAEQTRLESCRRVRNNFISPIANEEYIINGQKVDYPCYGIDLGGIFGSSFGSSGASVSISQTPIIPATDNWFCCLPRD